LLVDSLFLSNAYAAVLSLKFVFFMSLENNNDLFAAAPKPFLSSDKPGKPTGSRKRLMEEKVQG
jgi:hypothetical protein